MGAHEAVTIVAVTSAAELETWVQTYNRSSPCRRESVEYTRHAWEIADESQGFLALRDGVPVGAGYTEVESWTPATRVASSAIAVVPEARRTGVGTRLYRAVSDWAVAHGREGVEVWFDVAAREALRFWERRGFVEVGRERLSHLDLAAADPGSPVLPDGVRLITLADRDDLEPGMYRVGREGTEDVPGPEAYEAGDFGHWRHGELGWPDLRRDCSVVALAGEEVVGYAILVELTAQGSIAEHEMTAVARHWRGQGLALAMKQRQIALARQAGLATLEAMNEERNAPMLTVNTRLGYRPVTAWVQLRGPLAG